MKKLSKRLCSVILATSIIAALPMNGITTHTNTEKMFFTSVSAEESVQDGKTDDGITYIYDSEKVVIKGYEGTASELVIPEKINGIPVTNIADGAFKENTTIESVIINASISDIPESCFQDCINLKDIKIPETVTTIDSFAFIHCNFTEIELPENLTQISDMAFFETKSLIEITLPESITTIGMSVFEGCTSLKKVDIYCYFDGFYSLFRDCSSLEKVNFYGGMSSMVAEFRNCTSLKSMVIPEGAVSIQECFENCPSLTSLYIPESMRDLISVDFSNCYFLTIYGKTGSPVKSYAQQNNIPFVALENPDEMPTDTVVNTGQTDTGLKYIHNGEKAIITGCSITEAVEELVIPKKIDTAEVMNITASAFQNLTNVEKVVIEAEIEEIPKNCFSQASIKSIVFPETLKFIDESAFAGSALSGEIVIPDSVEKIGTNVFSNCYSIKSAVVSDNLTELPYGTFEQCYDLKTVTLGDSLTLIDSHAFNDDINLESVIIPEKVTDIKWRAFYNCNKLAFVSVPDSLATIEDEAFTNCDLMTFYGNENTYAHQYAEENGIRFSTEEMVVSDVQEGEVDGIKYIAVNGECVITAVKLTDEINQTITIPKDVDYNTVIDISEIANIAHCKNLVIEAELEAIPESCFAFNSVETVIISSKVKKLGMTAFYGCENLKSITLPDELEVIGNSAFKGCVSLENIDWPENLTVIEDWAFSECNSLKSVKVPDSVTDINAGFADSEGLETIELNDKITTLDYAAFMDCSSLKTITLPESIKEVSMNAFYGCNSLENLTLPEGITKIDSSSFKNCKSLKSMVLPENLTAIKDSTFYNCEKMTGIYISDKVTDIASDAFENCYFLVISAPEGSYAIEYAKKNNIKYIEISKNYDDDGFNAGLESDVIENLDDAQELPIISGSTSAVFDANSVIEIKHRHGNKDICFSYDIKSKTNSDESDEVNEVIENGGKLLDFDLTDENGEKVEFNSQDNNGTVTITVPYTKPVSANEVWVYYIAPDGTKTNMNGVYDPSTKTITFTTTHFSYYSIESDGDVKPDVVYDVYDVNLDGNVNIADAVILQQYLVKKTDKCEKAANLNNDKNINIFDLMILKNKLLKM